MKHKDFHYVNVALEGVHNRKGIYSIQKLGDPTGKTDTYCTYFRYNQDMKTHFDEKGTVSGYQGQAWSDWLPIDIDSDDLQQAQFYLQALTNNLEEHEIDIDTCRFYFSGAKGFHIMIPSTYFTNEPSHDIHKRFRKIAVRLSEGMDIDTSIYDKTRIFRLANTIHSKTNLYKVELYPFEALNSSIENIQEIAQQPREQLDIETDFDISESLTKLYHESLHSQPNGQGKKAKAKMCMQTLMKGVEHGNRDNVGVRVASHLRQSGLTPKMMWVALNEWNESNNPQLDGDEIERIFEQGLQDYEFGCHDPILKENCDPNCLFYREEWQRF